jgi:hypothetical protein
MIIRIGGPQPRSSGFFGAVLGLLAAVAMAVLAVFAFTAVLIVGAVVLTVGFLWWQFSGKKRFAKFSSQPFTPPGMGSHDAPGTPREPQRDERDDAPHWPGAADAPRSARPVGRVIEGEVIRRD